MASRLSYSSLLVYEKTFHQSGTLALVHSLRPHRLLFESPNGNHNYAIACAAVVAVADISGIKCGDILLSVGGTLMVTAGHAFIIDAYFSDRFFENIQESLTALKTPSQVLTFLRIPSDIDAELFGTDDAPADIADIADTADTAAASQKSPAATATTTTPANTATTTTTTIGASTAANSATGTTTRLSTEDAMTILDGKMPFSDDSAADIGMRAMEVAERARGAAAVAHGNLGKPHQGNRIHDKDDGSVYVGDLNERGSKAGFGRVSYKNGDKYEGEWNYSSMDGSGVFWSADGNVFAGQFVYNKLSGLAVSKAKEGGGCAGNWSRGKRHGLAVWTSADGKISYAGNFTEGLYNGKGVRRCNDRVYMGDFTSGQRHGHGVVMFFNGESVDCDFVNNQPEGRGVKRWPCGDVYDGHMLGENRQGRGVHLYANGDVYDGEWRGDKPHGRGLYVHANGDTFEGTWREGERHGRGVLTYANGTACETVWANGIVADNNTTAGMGSGVSSVFQRFVMAVDAVTGVSGTRAQRSVATSASASATCAAAAATASSGAVSASSKVVVASTVTAHVFSVGHRGVDSGIGTGIGRAGINSDYNDDNIL